MPKRKKKKQKRKKPKKKKEESDPKRNSLKYLMEKSLKTGKTHLKNSLTKSQS